MPLRSHTRLLDSTESGPIALISFSGDYPHGSAGDKMALKMKAVVTAAVKKFHPSGVVLDLLELNYRWGDAISGLFWALSRDDRKLLPSCVVAKDPTRRGLMRLFQASRAPVLFQTKFVSGIDEAVAHLANRSRRYES